MSTDLKRYQNLKYHKIGIVLQDSDITILLLIGSMIRGSIVVLDIDVIVKFV